MTSSRGRLAVLSLLYLLALAPACDSSARAEDPAPGDAGPAAITAWIARLPYDTEASTPAADALTAIGAPAVDALRRAVRTNAPSGALRVLARLGPVARPALPAVVEALESEDKAVRTQAADALSKIGTPDGAALDALLSHLGDDDDDVRRAAYAAAITSGRIDAAAVGRNLAARRTHAATAQALSSVGADAIPVLRALLSDPAWRARLAAAQALGHLGQKASSAAADLRRTLADESEDVRVAGLQALVATEDASAESRAALLAQAQVGSEWLRASLLRALGAPRYDAPETAAALERAATDSNPRIRLAAAYAAFDRGRPTAAAWREVTLAVAHGPASVPFANVRARAHRNLRAGGHSSSDVDPFDAFGIVLASEPKAAVAALEAAAGAASGEDRRILVRALGHLGAPAADALGRAVLDRDVGVAIEAAIGLSVVDPSRSSPAAAVLVAEVLRDAADRYPPAREVDLDDGDGDDPVDLAVVAFGSAAAPILGAALDRASELGKIGETPSERTCLRLLERMGRNGGPAAPAVARLLMKYVARGSGVRVGRETLLALGDAGVTALVAYLDSGEATSRSEAVAALASFKGAARGALPALEQAARRWGAEDGTREAYADAIRAIRDAK